MNKEHKDNCKNNADALERAYNYIMKQKIKTDSKKYPKEK